MVTLSSFSFYVCFVTTLLFVIPVYGVRVPNTDGKAGMACLSLDSAQLKPKELYDFVSQHLPYYALPFFLRIRPNMQENDKTATLKFQKYRYSTEGFDPAHSAGDLFYFYDKTPGVETYVPISATLHSQICAGAYRL